MPFGEVVVGSPGSGKSTYCYGQAPAPNCPLSAHLHSQPRPRQRQHPYPCAIDISSLITLQDVMETHGLGPNGAMLYCMEYLEANFDWLEERLRELGEDAYVLFDLPGQVELSTNHDSVKNIVQRLAKELSFRLAAVHLCDAHYITDALKVHLRPSALTPRDAATSSSRISTSYPRLICCTNFNLDFYTEVQDLSYLENTLNASLPPRFVALNMAIISLIEDFGLVGFETLAVEDKNSMLNLTRTIDRATGYIFVPAPDAPQPPGTIIPPSSSNSDSTPGPAPLARPNVYSLFGSAMGQLQGPASDVRDVQERWLDAREEYDAFERREWRKEGEAVRDAGARAKAEKEAEARAQKEKAEAGAGAGVNVKSGIRERRGPVG
ncbi:hypothetical protein CPB84DRAFT_1843466 [Gymnopilus junonius]|uniref:GPN-loop GTPase 2 n=1 Tax=Gymnopilus junonius TaxID=109634 RepID=A0A9P5NTG8_GYMJU|nr:hypothetical protein CPB84DRAFT_1843466 [Gymnopilus junonius]